MTFRLSILLLVILSVTACQQTNKVLTKMNIPNIPDYTDRLNSGTNIHNNPSKIKQLQRLLTKKGYNTNGIDGKVGPGTKAAIKRYQKDNNLTVDGLASVKLLDQVQGSSRIASKGGSSKGKKEDGFKMEQCVSSKTRDRQAAIKVLFNSASEKLQIDLDSYLKGFCVPEDKKKLAKLYVFLVTEGAIHSRIAEIKYNELIAVYKKAGVSIAIEKDSFRRSTGDKLIDDIKISAKDRMDGATILVKNSYQPEDNASFQENMKRAYDEIEDKSPYKEQARQLLSAVFVHSSSSTFYLARSSYTIDQLSSYFGIDVKDGISFIEKGIMVANQVFQNMNLAYFLLSKQDDLLSMLVSSTYSIKALTEDDAKDIPKPDSKVATREVREYKEKGGFTLDEMEIDFNKDNIPTKRS